MQTTRRTIGTRAYELRADGHILGTIEADNGMWLVRIGGTGYQAPEWFRTEGEAVAQVETQGGRLAARWDRALARAIAAGVDPLAIAGEQNRWAVESATRPGVAYIVSGREATKCTCEAARGGDAVCLHRAAVQAQLGLLPLPEAVEAAPVACRNCRGTGRVWGADHRADAVEARCVVCAGAGSLTADQAATIAGWAAA